MWGMALLRFGTIREYDGETHTVSVEVTGYRTSLLVGVRVADNIDGEVCVEGAGCVLALNDAFNVADACVIAVYGGEG
jgi:hypothetical protein